MKNLYKHSETLFEKLTAVATAILGSSFTFILALGMVIFFLTNRAFHRPEIQEFIRDAINSLTFLSLFIIQKEFNRFSGALHVKVNELITSHKPANNAMRNVEHKTEHEIKEMSKGIIERIRKAPVQNGKRKNSTSYF